MTDDGVPAQEQPMWLAGQPWSREMAVQALADFDADKDGRVKAALGGDIARQQERAAYWMMARGHQPGAEPTMPTDGSQVAQQMDQRERDLAEARLGAWFRHIPLNPLRRSQMERGLATKNQIEEARQFIARAKADPEFGRKVLAGNMEARETWASAHFVAHHCREAPENYDWAKDGF